jgi:hypothetical protein
MLTKIRSLCLEIHAIKEGSNNNNNISKLPEFTNQDKNSHCKDYNNVKDALHYTDYKGNKYGSQTHPSGNIPDIYRHYEEHCQGHHPLVEDETTKWARQAATEARGVPSRHKRSPYEERSDCRVPN